MLKVHNRTCSVKFKARMSACPEKLINIFSGLFWFVFCFLFVWFFFFFGGGVVQKLRSTSSREIRRLPRQSWGIYCGNVARIKTANRQRDVVLRRLINLDLKNNYAFKSKEMMNSSNYILVTYLSDIE